MKLYVIRIRTRTTKTERPMVQSYLPAHNRYAPHYTGDGFPLTRETGNCWYVEQAPDGLPTRYRKADEYKLIGNGEGLYMFGSDSHLLLDRWAEAVGT